MTRQTDQNSSRVAVADLRRGDRIIVWTSESERDVVGNRCDSYEREDVVTVVSVTPCVDHAWWIDTHERGLLLYYSDGYGSPDFDRPKTFWDHLFDDCL